MAPLLLWVGSALLAIAPPQPAPWWNARVDASLDRLPERRAAWEPVLRATPVAERPGMAYLVADLPRRDLESLPPETLAANVALAYRARAAVSWGTRLPDEVFLDAVLPHASVTEPRASMRAEFLERYLPLIKDCETPGEAALKVNAALFKDYEVVYDTRRLRTDQNSRESIAQGMATCTGLSIMLVEACRAVSVPARVAGIASWPGRGGNHTWVEVWDDGWHFVGAAESDPKGLDHAWFVADAAKAVKDRPQNAIWAVTYRATGTHFPLVWDRKSEINAENVTDRYRRAGPVAVATVPRLMVEVRRGGQRVEAQVSALEHSTGSTLLSGLSLGPQADVNQHLCRPAEAGASYLVVARLDGQTAAALATVGKDDAVVHLDLDAPVARRVPAALLAERFGINAHLGDAASRLLGALPADDDARKLAWTAYAMSPRHDPLRKEFDARTVSTKDRTSRYLWRHVGTKPEKGWALVIAMHGGGGAPSQVNDSQWHGMFERYYREHPEAGGYVYLALRAPNDEWNGFYDDAICPLVARLVRQFVLFGEVDPDRVFALGASHGGYGAFVIGPKMPDRFAAVHASAAAPTDGETMGENLRDLRFTFMVGERDTAYGRAERCQAFAKKLEGWKAEYGGYPGGFEWKPGVGHSVPDRDKLVELLGGPPRDPWPKTVVWTQSDDVLTRSYWLESPRPADGAKLVARVDGQTISLTASKQEAVALWLDTPLIDLTRPVTIDVEGGKTTTVTPSPTLETYCRGLVERGDPRLAAPVRVEVPLR